MFHYVSL